MYLFSGIKDLFFIGLITLMLGIFIGIQLDHVLPHAPRASLAAYHAPDGGSMEFAPHEGCE